MATALKRRRQKRGENFFRQPNTNDTGADTEHVCVVVRTRQARGVQVVAQRGAYATHLVGRDLLALPAAAEHDAHIRPTVANCAADLGTNRRVIDTGGAVSSEIGDDVPIAGQHPHEVLLQFVASVVGANRDA